MSNNTDLLAAAIAFHRPPKICNTLRRLGCARGDETHPSCEEQWATVDNAGFRLTTPHIEFAGAAVLFYDNHTLPLRLSLPFFSVVATTQRNDMTQKLAKVAATVQGITESHTILYGRLLVAFEAYAKRSYDKSPSKDWTQKDAAKLLGISTRQLRTIEKVGRTYFLNIDVFGLAMIS